MALGIGLFVARLFIVGRPSDNSASNSTAERDIVPPTESTTHFDLLPSATSEISDKDSVVSQIERIKYEVVPYSLWYVENGKAFDFMKLSLAEAKDLKIDPSLSWIGLFKQGDHYRLTRTIVKNGQLMSDGLGITRRLYFKDSTKALRLFCDKGELPTGPVETIRYLSKEFTPNGEFVDGLSSKMALELRLGSDFYRVRVSLFNRSSDFPIQTVILEKGGVEQLIYFRSNFSGFDIGQINWAGDLDGDGLLDLELYYFEQNGGQGRRLLFISSQAGPGELVKAYAIE